MLKRLPVTVPALLLGCALLLPGCRPPEDLDRGGAPKLGELSESRRGSPPPRQGPGEDGASEAGGGDGDGDGVRLSTRGLGKEDYALIEAELRCIRGQFKEDADALTKATAAIFARYGASEDWVERVRAHLNGEPDVAERLEEMVTRRLAQICVDGVISPELLAEGPAAEPAEGADADVAAKDPEGEGGEPEDGAAPDGAPAEEEGGAEDGAAPE